MFISYILPFYLSSVYNWVSLFSCSELNVTINQLIVPIHRIYRGNQFRWKNVIARSKSNEFVNGKILNRGNMEIYVKNSSSERIHCVVVLYKRNHLVLIPDFMPFCRRVHGL